MLTDIDHLILECRSERARDHISEAYTSYKSGANRAAIVAAWVAIVFDVVDKLYELSLSGDANAKAQIAKFEQYQEQLRQGNNQALLSALEFERNILDLAKDEFDLLDQQQYLDLTRLREDRHRCAHPTFQTNDETYKPSSELARLHIVNAIKHVLTRPPVQGKAAFDRVEKTILSDYFPEDLEKAKQALAETEFGRPTEALTKLLVDKLLFGSIDDGPHKWRRRTYIALAAVVELQRAIAEPRLREQFKKIAKNMEDGDLPLVIIVMSHFPALADLLTPPQLDRLRAFTRSSNVGSIPATVVGLGLPSLRDTALERLASATLDELGEMTKFADRAPELVERAVSMYCDAKSWVSANEIAEKLILPMTEALPKEAIERIIRAPRTNGADLIGSNRFPTFIARVREGKSKMSVKDFDQLLTEEGLERFITASI